MPDTITLDQLDKTLCEEVYGLKWLVPKDENGDFIPIGAPPDTATDDGSSRNQDGNSLKDGEANFVTGCSAHCKMNAAWNPRTQGLCDANWCPDCQEFGQAGANGKCIDTSGTNAADGGRCEDDKSDNCYPCFCHKKMAKIGIDPPSPLPNGYDDMPEMVGCLKNPSLGPIGNATDKSCPEHYVGGRLPEDDPRAGSHGFTSDAKSICEERGKKWLTKQECRDSNYDNKPVDCAAANEDYVFKVDDGGADKSTDGTNEICWASPLDGSHVVRIIDDKHFALFWEGWVGPEDVRTAHITNINYYGGGKTPAGANTSNLKHPAGHYHHEYVYDSSKWEVCNDIDESTCITDPRCVWNAPSKEANDQGEDCQGVCVNINNCKQINEMDFVCLEGGECRDYDNAPVSGHAIESQCVEDGFCLKKETMTIEATHPLTGEAVTKRECEEKDGVFGEGYKWMAHHWVLGTPDCSKIHTDTTCNKAGGEWRKSVSEFRSIKETACRNSDFCAWEEDSNTCAGMKHPQNTRDNPEFLNDRPAGGNVLKFQSNSYGYCGDAAGDGKYEFTCNPLYGGPDGKTLLDENACQEINGKWDRTSRYVCETIFGAGWPTKEKDTSGNPITEDRWKWRDRPPELNINDDFKINANTALDPDDPEWGRKTEHQLFGHENEGWGGNPKDLWRGVEYESPHMDTDGELNDYYQGMRWTRHAGEFQITIGSRPQALNTPNMSARQGNSTTPVSLEWYVNMHDSCCNHNEPPHFTRCKDGCYEGIGPWLDTNNNDMDAMVKINIHEASSGKTPM